MEKRFYFDSERKRFDSINIGDFFTNGDPTNEKVFVYMRIEPVIQDECIVCNVVNLETGGTYTWFDDDKVYPVESAAIEIKV